jgi:hypothetical protein
MIYVMWFPRYNLHQNINYVLESIYYLSLALATTFKIIEFYKFGNFIIL